jgi:hypothetical protein
MGRSMLVLVLVVAAAACSDEGASAAGGADRVIAAWKKAGLTPTAFDAADGARYGGGTCRAGQVNGVDVVLCAYPSAEEASAAAAAGLETIGETTGSAISQGSMLLVVADRRKADPEGRTINQLTKIFRGP